jgi:mRNA interferase MazF
MAKDCQSGSIVNIDLGEPSNEVKGHEQGLERPCAAIKVFPKQQLMIIVPCTSKVPKFLHYTVVSLPKGCGGLPKHSYVLCHQIRTVSYDRVLNIIGILDTKTLLKVKNMLLDALDL